jgi:hypothetical protein
MPATPASKVLDRVLVLEMVRVTEAAAIAAAKLIGRGDEKAADHAAVEAMRAALNELAMDGTVVIGEGERDEAPMLFIGEKVGSAQGTGPKIDIALDPLEGTTITAKAGPNALAVLAIAEEGNLLNAPDVYMDKLAIGPGYPDGIIDLAKSPTENVKAVAAAKGVEPGDLIVCVLDRPRPQMGHRRPQQDLQTRRSCQRRLHFCCHRGHRWLSARWRQAAQEWHRDYRERGNAGKFGHGALGQGRAPEGELSPRYKSSGVTSTDTFMRWPALPMKTPSSGDTSAKSRPMAVKM